MSVFTPWVQIKYKQNMPFEIDQGVILPSQIPQGLAAGVYTILVPPYCLDSNGKIQNSIMWKLYPQFSKYDFAAGQV